MSNEDIFSCVLESLSKIKNIIEKSDLEACLKETKLDKATKLKKSKEFVDELFELSKNIRGSLEEQYKILQTEDLSDTVVPIDNVLTNGLDTTISLGNESNGENVENNGNNVEDSTSSDTNVVAIVDSNRNEDEPMETSSQDEIYLNETIKIPEDNEKESSKEDESDPLTDAGKEPENEPVSTDTTANADDTQNGFKENDIKKENPEEPPRKSLIRLVDLSKLMDPDKHKSVKFDTSVIVLSSSEEETNVSDTILKPELVTVTKNILKEPANSKEPENKVKSPKEEKKVRFEIEKVSDSDDSDSDKNFRKSRRLRNNQKEKTKRENNFKTLFKRVSKKSIDINSGSSSDSDAEQSKKNTKGQLRRQCKDDTKFDSKVYVPLPYFECDKLKEVYNTNKECFNILSSQRLESLRKSKRSRNTAENESSSDTEKAQNKKSKTKGVIISSDEEKSTKKNSKAKRKGNDKNSNKEVDSDEETSNKKTSKSVARKSAKAKENSEDEATAKKENLDSGDEKNVKSNSKSMSGKGATKEESSKEDKSTDKPSKKNKSTVDNEDSDADDEEKSKKRKIKGTVSTSENSEDNSDNAKSAKKKLKTTNSISTKEDSDEKSDKDKLNKKPTEKTDTEKKVDINKSKDSVIEDDKEKSEETKSEIDLSTDDDSTSKKSKDDDKKKQSSTDKKKKSNDDKKKKSNDDKKKKSDKNEESKESEDEDETKDTSTNKSKDNSSKTKTNSDSESEDTSTTKKKSGNPKSNKNDSDNDKEESEVASKKKASSDEDLQENENFLADVEESEDEKSKKKKGKKITSDDDEDDNASEKEGDDKSKAVTTSSSDSEGFSTFAKKREKAKEIASKAKKKVKKVVASDSDDSKSEKNDKQNSDSSQESSDSEASKKSSEEEKPKKQTSRRRIKKTKDSSEDSDEEVSTRKKIREVLGKSALSESTKQAEAEERERKARIAEKQKKYNRIFEEKKDAKIDKVVLDYHEETKEPILEVHKKIVKNLKPHQASGIQFMFDACFESLERMQKSEGSGCILAHCMGLGKTLQVISLAHTLLTNSEKTKVEKVLVVCPINTVLNWKSEFKKWMPNKSDVEIFELATAKKNYDREYTVKCWHEEGGVLIIGYNMFRLLSNPNNRKITKKMRTTFLEGMVDPGPDLVICDEGHLLKNEKTNLSIAMNRIKTLRRIVLTGTPLQNNLKEYWCMVQFIKPNLLGTYKEYMNRFVNPITNGQYTDSTQHDIVLMRKRSHVLHKLLDGVVQRRDYSVLEPYLPPKHEYVLFVRLSEVQTKMYKTYMEKYARKNDGSNRTSFLFTDFQQLQRICTHPRVLLDKTSEKKEKSDDEEDSEGSLKDFIDDNSSAHSTSSTSGSESDGDSDGSHQAKKKKTNRARMTRARTAQKKENGEEDSEPEVVEVVNKEWWQEYCDGDELDNIKHSGKLSLLFEILKECEEIGDKILVFSQSLYALNCIEYFLSKIDEATEAGDTEKFGGYKGSWSLGLDYFRIDGSSSCDNRAYWCDSFNNPDNVRARLFLISTKAGGLGINLVAANRVIIFDVSWNPSHDIQSIYRVYRFGQNKPSYIYRFVTYGAMEMKIYERQVTKQAISKRVIDEQQIDRHYNQNDLQELYKCDLEPTDRPVPLVPKDVLLGEMLQKYENIIYKYHLHQSLLENKEAEGLNEEERKAAWEEFENEKVFKKTYATAGNPFLNQPPLSQTGWANMQGMSARTINAALMNIVRRDNPTWAEHQIKGIIPALVRQLQVQIEENDMSMYQRVVQEIQIMNQAKMKESLYQQQMMQLYQQQYLFQKQQQAVLGNLKITPQSLQNIYGTPANYYAGNAPYMNGPSTSSTSRPSNDVIELND